jgi:hypothetical protein
MCMAGWRAAADAPPPPAPPRVRPLYPWQAGADFVWCNDHNPGNHEALVYNLVSGIWPDGRGAGW